MNQEDIDLFSVMQTIQLRHQMVMRDKHFHHEAEFAGFITAEMKRLKKRQRLSRSTFRYYHNALLPQRSGFRRRWQSRLQRCAEITRSVSAMKTLSDAERLALFFTHMEKSGFATKRDHEEDLYFDESETAKVLNKGFVGIAASQENMFSNGELSASFLLTYYFDGSYASAEPVIIHRLQSFGFNVEYDHSHNRLKKEHFAQVPVVSFMDLLVGQALEQTH